MPAITIVPQEHWRRSRTPQETSNGGPTLPLVVHCGSGPVRCGSLARQFTALFVATAELSSRSKVWKDLTSSVRSATPINSGSVTRYDTHRDTGCPWAHFRRVQLSNPLISRGGEEAGASRHYRRPQRRHEVTEGGRGRGKVRGDFWGGEGICFPQEQARGGTSGLSHA